MPIAGHFRSHHAVATADLPGLLLMHLGEQLLTQNSHCNYIGICWMNFLQKRHGSTQNRAHISSQSGMENEKNGVDDTLQKANQSLRHPANKLQLDSTLS